LNTTRGYTVGRTCDVENKLGSMTPSNKAAREQGNTPSSIHGFGATGPASILMEVGDPDIHTSSSAGPLESSSNAFGIASSMQGIPPLIARQGTGTSPETRETPPVFVNASHLASSSSSPALSSKSEERGHEDGSEESTPHGMGGRSERSGISPPMETASISSDPVPSTVEVQLRTKLVRPASTPHSLSKVRYGFLSIEMLDPCTHFPGIRCTAMRS
jgi:hypothetical protein